MSLFVYQISFADVVYEGPVKNDYVVTGTSQLVSCDIDPLEPRDLGSWYFGPSNLDGKCLNNPNLTCNYPFGFVTFDQGHPRALDLHEGDLCGVAGSWKSCSYLAVSVKSKSDGSDVVNVKTAVTSSSGQRVTSENDYPIERFLGRKGSFSTTANGCNRYEVNLEIQQLP